MLGIEEEKERCQNRKRNNARTRKGMLAGKEKALTLEINLYIIHNISEDKILLLF